MQQTMSTCRMWRTGPQQTPPGAALISRRGQGAMLAAPRPRLRLQPWQQQQQEVVVLAPVGCRTHQSSRATSDSRKPSSTTHSSW